MKLSIPFHPVLSGRLLALQFPVLCAAALLSTSAFALNKAEYEAATDHNKAQYQSAMTACKPLKGNDQDVCEKKAKADRTKADADAKASYKGTSGAREDAAETRVEQDAKVAKEKCESMGMSDSMACKNRVEKRKDAAEDAIKR